MSYAELHCLSNFSFQRGASSARELFERAKACGYAALAITDECTLAGIVRAYEAARETGVKLIVGAEIAVVDGPRLVLLCENRAGYVALCELITAGRRASVKGDYRLTRAHLDGLPGTLALWLPGKVPALEEGRWLREVFGDRLWLAVELHAGPDDAGRLRELTAVGAALDIPLVASGDVHMHVRRRRALQDVMTAVRHGRTVAEVGAVLFRNGERHLRTRTALAKVYPAELLAESVRIAERCRFSLDELRYEYPRELVPEGHTATSWLRALTERGLRWRWPDGEPAKVRAQVEHELALIAELRYEAYFLTVEDIVRFARGRGILCQGRGSAANSAVCFALGVTEVDPAKINLLVERFISRERDEPPDIDIDFEHERREEVLQYVYAKYGRERAALAATVICYRGKSAVRDVAKALGLPLDQVDRLSALFAWWDGDASSLDGRLREAGFDPDSAVIRRIRVLTGELMGFPRHLSQHVGGFVIADAPLSTLVPVENAAMPDRTIIQWDKDDLDALGLLKVDCLALGMLTCVRKCFELIARHRGTTWSMATLPAEDPETYALIQRADTLGVFQIESRAQMAMLPRHRPENFYDLVVQVAIVRPGPIQGDMVHPYLRRRRGEEEVTYPSEDLRQVFARTLGVPLFQEQVMQLAIVAAGYTPGEADELRRSMAAWKRHGGLEHHRERILRGMDERGYSRDFGERLFEQIKGFGSYGFPESHAASFAGIVYASCWLKCHEPSAFACALLNSQPMGFYAPSQIVQDAQRRGIRVLPVDVRYSAWDCTLEPGQADPAKAPLRLGFRMVRGMREASGHAIAAARSATPFADVADLCERAGLDERARALLAEAGALRGIAGHRHRALWTVAGVEAQLPLFGHGSPVEAHAILPPPSQGEDTLADYGRTGLTLGAHPLRQIRAQLRAARCLDSRRLRALPNDSRVRVAGIVTQRQRPQTASGVTFVTLEDEHGMVNVIVWRAVAEQHRRALLESALLGVEGQWQVADGVCHLIARTLRDMSALLGDLDVRSRDFR